MRRTAPVTGSVSGIGLACIKLLLKGRYQAIAFDPQEYLMRQNPREEKGISYFLGVSPNRKIVLGICSFNVDASGKLNQHTMGSTKRFSN